MRILIHYTILSIISITSAIVWIVWYDNVDQNLTKLKLVDHYIFTNLINNTTLIFPSDTTLCNLKISRFIDFEKVNHSFRKVWCHKLMPSVLDKRFNRSNIYLWLIVWLCWKCCSNLHFGTHHLILFMLTCFHSSTDFGDMTNRERTKRISRCMNIIVTNIRVHNLKTKYLDDLFCILAIVRSSNTTIELT